ncbi:hypothetical protein, conserved [Trypanosoma brucei gambiense DAL972]|uniref:Uncharacterized protein n=1 Tax=Trypanosoma brucei gambiense (strain MHOM/CI/86/DAL972) TaxID=679716 RepID=C9ZTM4_TRYB9|nr:hypothetical protein, conserved [Trypanosoma brucei gambiense DAL972]CBH12759.1 hypothetical protein, conserved [Trypanosoma brucei gambiense DAL972]|eukprot:XP_011775039.1 hypothetical protein, conserved [Trypanosoma brucei gambiense DAL972]
MRASAAVRCILSSTTLTSQITQLVQRAEQHLNVKPANPCSLDTSSTPVADNLWEQVMAVAPSARALKETDTLLALVFRLLRNGLQPPSGEAAAETWSALIRDLAPYSDVEANSVLSYPGTPECAEELRGAMANALCAAEGRNNANCDLDDRPLLRLTRETLLLTGGVVPLSARVPCSDGGAIGQLLDAFCVCCEASGNAMMSSASLEEMSKAVLSALHVIAETVDVRETSPLVLSLLRFMRLLGVREKGQYKQNDESMGSVASFAEELTSVLANNGLGARIVLFFVHEHCEATPEEMVPLPLVCLAARGIWRHYRTADTTFPCLEHLKYVNGAVDVTLQRNANNNNILGLQENEEGDLRLQVSLALLKGMRLHADSPDVFLRSAIDVVDSCPASLSLEYEVLVAKTNLLDMFADDEASCSAIYDDLLQSLRALVELRPRDAENDVSSMNTHEGGEGDAASDGKVTRKKKLQIKHMEEDRQLLREQFQEAHRIVVEAFVRSRIQERLNQAYTILVTHKYHGLVITQEVAYPLLDVLSRRGDCRVFNIIDLCVLYSGCTIDYDALTCLFRACRVAGDFYRARTLYQLLKEMIPGFLLRAPTTIREMLRELKVLDPEPTHLFADTLLGNGTMGGTECPANILPVELIDEDDPSNRRRGPLRELPSAKAE